MYMLSKDREMFDRAYPEASSFLLAAGLRKECYGLALQRTRTISENIRLCELLESAPACKEAWFVKQLEGDCDEEVRAIIEEMCL